MKMMQENLLQKLEKLAISLQMNENELKNCVSKVKELAPDKQEQYLEVLDNIKNQLRPINFEQLNKVKDVLGIKKFGGPALLSHVKICLQQSQLVAESINQSKELIDQAYNASKYNPGTKSKMQLNAEMNMKAEEAEEEAEMPELTNQNNSRPRPNTTQTSRAKGFNPGDNPRLNRTPRFGENVVSNTPIRSNFALLTPQMVLLAKIIRIQQVARSQKNVAKQLQSDAYVDKEISRLDKMADKRILEIDKKADERILKLDKMADADILKLDKLINGKMRKDDQGTHKILDDILKESHSMEAEVYRTLEDKITAQSQLLEEAFLDRQMAIKNGLSAIRQNTAEQTNTERMAPQYPKP